MDQYQTDALVTVILEYLFAIVVCYDSIVEPSFRSSGSQHSIKERVLIILYTAIAPIIVGYVLLELAVKCVWRIARRLFS